MTPDRVCNLCGNEAGNREYPCRECGRIGCATCHWKDGLCIECAAKVLTPRPDVVVGHPKGGGDR